MCVCESYCKSFKGFFEVKDIDERITVGNGQIMMATKIKSLECRVVQLEGNGTIRAILNISGIKYHSRLGILSDQE
jgi:hypothetical protein